MKAKILSLALCVIMALGAIVPASAAAPVYADGVALEVIVAPQYEEVGDMNEGYAPVKVNGKWGYINERGEMVIQPKYEAASPVSGGIAVVSQYGTAVHAPDFGYDGGVSSEPELIAYAIDMQGNENVLLCTAAFGSDYHGPSPYRKGYFTVGGMTEYTASDCQNGVILMYRAFGADGIEIEPIEKSNWHNEYRSTSYNAGVISSVAYAYGAPMDIPDMPFLMDKNGNVIKSFDTLSDSPIKAYKVCYSASDVYMVSYRDENTRKTYHVLEDANGNNLCGDVTFADYFQYMDEFAFNGLITVKGQGGGWGVIDVTGKTVLPFSYDLIDVWSSPIVYHEQNGMVGYIDRNGTSYQVASPDGGVAEIEEYCAFDLSGVAVVTDKADRTYCISVKAVDGILPLIRGLDGYTPVSSNDGYVIIEKSGKYGFAKLTDGASTPSVPSIAPGTPIGDVEYTKIVAYIDGKPIRSYNIGGNTHIVIEDLIQFGFEFRWIAEGNGRAVITGNRTATPDAYTTTYTPDPNAPTEGVAMQYLATNVTAWLGEKQVTGYNIGGQTCIWLDDLHNVFGYGLTWDGVEGALRLTTQP